MPGTARGDTATVVLVHGGFADASSWNGVITRLQAKGVPVTAPANPLRGMAPGGRGNRRRTIEGGIGHNLPQEAPAAFADAVLDIGNTYPLRRSK
jgi:pimeloyl-ACP methyl ester carboxylesterase